MTTPGGTPVKAAGVIDVLREMLGTAQYDLAAARAALRESLAECEALRNQVGALQRTLEDLKRQQPLYLTQEKGERPVDGDGALARVILAGLADPEFAAAWEQAVRDGADTACAQIAGARMAGQKAGELAWHAQVPVPDGADEQDVTEAYRYAVAAEAARRLDGSRPGKFG
jgi:hypothetical protein